MRYDNSLTSSVQKYIEQKLAKRIREAWDNWELIDVAQDIRTYLCDSTTINTPDFVIRRFIQKYYPELLPCNMDVPNLLENKNIAWNDQIIDSLATTLFHLSVERQTNITKAEWKRYFSGHGATQSEKVYQIAFTLGMDVDSTIDLFLALGMEPYSVRCPLDLICLFCQRVPGKYTWPDVMEMLTKFTTNQAAHTGICSPPTDGMTQQISYELDAIFAKCLPDADAKEELITYMLEHAEEFPSFEVKKGKRDYLPGYSLSRMRNFNRFAEFLILLYPQYSYVDERAKKQDNAFPVKETEMVPRKKRREESSTGNIREVRSNDPESKEKPLPFLARSMIYNSGWNDITWTKSNNEILDSRFQEFEDSMRKMCNNFVLHMNGIDRMQKGNGNPQFFTRRDALLFIYFLFYRYCRLDGDSSEAEAINKYIDQMLDERDNTLGHVINQALENANASFNCEKTEDRFRYLMTGINLILTWLDYPQLYLPARFDRFIILSLLSEDVDSLTPLVMSENEWLDDDDLQFNEEAYHIISARY